MLKHTGFINLTMSEVLEMLSEFKKHLGSFVERKDLLKDLGWEQKGMSFKCEGSGTR